MSYEEFWNESLDRLEMYWQANQYNIERRNQELWLQGIYIRDAIACCLSKKNKYPEKPHRLTALSEVEKELENKRKVEQLREALNMHRQRWLSRQNGVDAV